MSPRIRHVLISFLVPLMAGLQVGCPAPFPPYRGPDRDVVTPDDVMADNGTDAPEIAPRLDSGDDGVDVNTGEDSSLDVDANDVAQTADTVTGTDGGCEGGTLCRAQCMDFQTSCSDCGSCGNACGLGQYCVMGTCHTPDGCELVCGNANCEICQPLGACP